MESNLTSNLFINNDDKESTSYSDIKCEPKDYKNLLTQQQIDENDRKSEKRYSEIDDNVKNLYWKYNVIHHAAEVKEEIKICDININRQGEILNSN